MDESRSDVDLWERVLEKTEFPFYFLISRYWIQPFVSEGKTLSNCTITKILLFQGVVF